ncbi:MAG: homoserine dehydrogenase [Helicobacter sp.]|nr:homoserine dehydrogenase [Helicobacter sp.]
MRELGVGIIGVGVVGSAVVKILHDSFELIQSRANVRLKPICGVVRDLAKTREIYDLPLTNSIDELINNPEIHIVIELMGGIDKSYEVAKKVISKNKALVTANKAMLAYHRFELERLARDYIGSSIGFEASVCGGVPVIKILKDGMSANHILRISGILNGTSNFILSQMEENKSFEEALNIAQNLGYAEADPTLDLDGSDAAHKLLILSSLAYGIDAKPEDISISGIYGLQNVDIDFAKNMKRSIKLLANAILDGNNLSLSVELCMIKDDEMLAKINGVNNALSIIGDRSGEILVSGLGAGGQATASAVISDLIEVARGKSGLNFGHKLHRELILQDLKDIKSRFYIRFFVLDKIGVLEEITNIFKHHNISLELVYQNQAKTKQVAQIQFVTHLCTRSDLQSAISKINDSSFCAQKAFVIKLHEQPQSQSH